MYTIQKEDENCDTDVDVLGKRHIIWWDHNELYTWFAASGIAIYQT